MSIISARHSIKCCFFSIFLNKEIIFNHPILWWISMGNHPHDLAFNPTSHSCLLEPSKQLSQLISYNPFCLSTKPWLLMSSVDTVPTVFYLPEIHYHFSFFHGLYLIFFIVVIFAICFVLLLFQCAKRKKKYYLYCSQFSNISHN